MVENENVVLFREDQCEDESDDVVPCRIITDFVVFDIANGNKLVPLENFEDEDAELRVAGMFLHLIFSYDFSKGLVSPKFVEKEEEDDESETDLRQLATQRMSTTTIFRSEVVYKENGLR